MVGLLRAGPARAVSMGSPVLGHRGTQQYRNKKLLPRSTRAYSSHGPVFIAAGRNQRALTSGDILSILIQMESIVGLLHIPIAMVYSDNRRRQKWAAQTGAAHTVVSLQIIIEFGNCAHRPHACGIKHCLVV